MAVGPPRPYRLSPYFHAGNPLADTPNLIPLTISTNYKGRLGLCRRAVAKLPAKRHNGAILQVNS